MKNKMNYGCYNSLEEWEGFVSLRVGVCVCARVCV